VTEPTGEGEAKPRDSRTKSADAASKKKRKKRKPVADAASITAPAVADRPPFAQAFPSDAELDRLLACFQAGDYASVRSGAPALAHATKSDDVRRAARELQRRIEPDRTATLLLGLAVALLAYLSWWHWAHPHGAGG